jgi:hypothetical protein
MFQASLGAGLVTRLRANLIDSLEVIMALCETVEMAKDGNKMRVNSEDVAKYRAQGWETTGSTRRATAQTIPAGGTPMAEVSPEEAAELTEGAEAKTPALVTMEKDGATVDVAPADVAVREEAGWVVATETGQEPTEETQ